ncbi:ketose-bisphosphate aldolase [Iocasia frigidifontis]|uniref:Ketose-bisphosphate aldolase n=1 Tax=Iocasia fonsfrigidae TaxID=2682810 RepID=A0A8A7KL78_9FIRM|nr:class II fructose-bisphosphate aldolase [Iocasia fonsfrigidae]QTL99587.1 ketose-bisphosphate aldolase [Iocasia fonsfrigidae]
MGLVSLKEILGDARKKQYAVPAFDTSNYNMVSSVVDVAEELRSPVILMGLKPDLTDDQFDHLAVTMKTIAEKATVPVCIHLDHATNSEIIKKAISQGYSSVMFDGSVLPLEENIKKTKEVVDYAHEYGVSVEAELGHVGDGIVGCSESEGEHKSTLTDPKEMEYFIKETEVDALAVSIGTAHGVYVAKPELDIKLLKELNQVSTVPLVMHGGSGTPDNMIEKSAKNGICKINIFSEILNAFFTAMKEKLNSTDNMSMWPHMAYEEPTKAMKETIEAKILLFGSNNRY